MNDDDQYPPKLIAVVCLLVTVVYLLSYVMF